jgi:uncharacterized protein (TIGR02466 family)
MAQSDMTAEATGQIVQTSLDIKSLFPTPLVIVSLEGAAAINEDLTARIVARSKTHPSVTKTNLGGWQSETDFQSWSGPYGAAILQAAQQLANMTTAVSEPTGLKRTEVPWKLNAWANLNGAGHANEMHTHAGAFWSGAYYVDAGDPDSGGEFEILDPRGVTPIMYAPQLKIAINGCLAAGLSEYVVPQSGQLFLFPSWLFHGVRPYRGTRPRLSVAFNLCV